MQQSQKWKLEQFNVRAKYLDESRFIKWIYTRGNKQPNISSLLKGSWLVYEGLPREDLDSFILNLRLLIQDRDGYSIRCLSKIYDGFPNEFDNAKSIFREIRKSLQIYLNEQSIIQVSGNTFSKEMLLNIVLYGGFAHNDPKYYAHFIRTTQSGVISMLTFVEFVNIITVLNGRIQQIAILNEEVISWLT